MTEKISMALTADEWRIVSNAVAAMSHTESEWRGVNLAELSTRIFDALMWTEEEQ